MKKILIDIEILKYNYWEHFRAAKELSLILPIDHPRRKIIEAEFNKLAGKIKQK